MPYSFNIFTNPRGYSITNGEKTHQWTANAPHVLQPTPDDGTVEWLERAAQAAVAMFDQLEITEPLERQREQTAAAVELLTEKMARTQAQTMDLSDQELDIVGKAGMFDEWTQGEAYTAGKRLFYEGITYLVLVDVPAALEHQYPGAEGMMTVYQPVDPATGTADDPKNLLSGMKPVVGLYYKYNGSVWECLRELDAVFTGRFPGDTGMESYWAKAGVTVAAMVATSEPQYCLNTSGTYHAAGCSYVSESGYWLTLADIAATRPDAKPCTRCQPPEISA